MACGYISLTFITEHTVLNKYPLISNTHFPVGKHLGCFHYLLLTVLLWTLAVVALP